MSKSSREGDIGADPIVEDNAEEPVIRKVFIANVNSYQGKAIAKKIPDIKHHITSPTGKFYEIYGSLQINEEIDKEVVETYAPRILDRKKPTYMQSILECEIIIYDIGMHASQVTEAQQVLDLLETRLTLCEPAKNEPTKYFILISTPLVWSRTPIVDTEESAESLSETDFRKRRPHPCYVKHQYLEREVMNAQSRHKNSLRTIVFCPGVTYGGRNDIFHYIFKKAYYNKETICIYQPDPHEPNYVPMVYINDFAQMVFAIIEDFPREKHRYILGVQPKPMSLKTFATIVAKSLAGNPIKVKICSKEEILSTSDSLVSQRIYHYLSLNLRMTSTYFKDFIFTFAEDNYENMGDILADEFKSERNLLPIKIIVDGPPCVGKTTLCKALADEYEIHYVDPESVVYNEQKISETKSYLRYLHSYEHGNSGVEGELDFGEGRGEEFEAFKQMRKISSEVIRIAGNLEDQLVDWEAELADLNEYMLTMKEGDEMEVAYVKKCLVEILSSKPCSENQGYVVDGFPFDYTQAAEIFPSHLFHDNLEEEGETEAPQTSKHSMVPNFFVMLTASDDILCKRAMNLSEKEAIETKNTEEQLKARLIKYRERTEEDVACSSYFSDNQIIPIIIKVTSDMPLEQLLDTAKKQIGPPHTYPLTRTQMEEIAKSNLKAKAKAEEIENMKREQLAAAEAADKERKLREWSQKFEHLKRQEQEIRQAKSMPLRSYLCKYVLPTLTEGLLKVAEAQPEDPIEFLAEYLFTCNPTGHVLDPAYSEEAKRLLLSLNCDIEKTAVDDEKGETKNENLECDDSFIARHLDHQESNVSMEKKRVRAQTADAPESSSSETSNPTQAGRVKRTE